MWSSIRTLVENQGPINFNTIKQHSELIIIFNHPIYM
jgi:hypothetical protein